MLFDDVYIHINDYLLTFRPSSGEVLAHCLFWSKEKRLKFFQEVSDWIQWAFKSKPPGSIVVDEIEKEARSVFVKNWKDSIDEELKQGMTMLTTHSTIYLTCLILLKQERMSVAKQRKGASNTLNQLLSNQGLERMSIYRHNC